MLLESLQNTVITKANLALTSKAEESSRSLLKYIFNQISPIWTEGIQTFMVVCDFWDCPPYSFSVIILPPICMPNKKGSHFTHMQIDI